MTGISITNEQLGLLFKEHQPTEREVELLHALLKARSDLLHGDDDKAAPPFIDGTIVDISKHQLPVIINLHCELCYPGFHAGLLAANGERVPSELIRASLRIANDSCLKLIRKVAKRLIDGKPVKGSVVKTALECCNKEELTLWMDAASDELDREPRCPTQDDAQRLIEQIGVCLRPQQLEPAMKPEHARGVLESYCHNDLVQFRGIIDAMVADGSSMDGDRTIEQRDREMGLNC